MDLDPRIVGREHLGPGTTWGSVFPGPTRRRRLPPAYQLAASLPRVDDEGRVVMVRRYVQPVDVLRRDDLPAQFRWRGRWYDVRAVLAHWFEAGGWWRSPAAAAVFGADHAEARPVGDLVLGSLPPSPKWGQRAWGEPAPDVGAAIGAAAVDDGEQELWRVEAAASECGAGVFDLCFDWSAGGWTVARVLD